MKEDFIKLRNSGIAGILCWPDHDQPGYTKAKKVKEICAELNIPYIQLDPLRVWDKMPEKGDIIDYWVAHSKEDKKVVWDILVSSIRDYNEEKLDPIARAIAESIDKEMPKANQLIKLYKENPDPVYQQLLIKQFIDWGYNGSIINAIISGAESAPKHPPTVMTATQFNNLIFDTSGWIYPELIIDSGVQLLGGKAGASKSTFAYSLLFHFLDNQPFLGEELSIDAKRKKKLGLIINSDQPCREAQAHTLTSPLALKTQRDDKWHIIGGNPNEEKWTLRYLPWLEEQVRKYRYSMIVIDSYKAIHAHLPGWDENDTNADLGIRALSVIAEKYNCCIIVIAHDGKKEEGTATDKIRGNSSIPSAASAVMNLTKTKEDKDGKRDPLMRFLEISKLRNAAEGKMQLRYNPEYRTFDALPSSGGIDNRVTLNHIATTLFTSTFAGNYNEYSHEELKRGFQTGVGGDRSLFLTRVLSKLEQRGLVQRVMKGDNIYYRSRSFPTVKVEDLI